MTITYVDFSGLGDLNAFCNEEKDITIISIESIPFNDKPMYFYRVWIRRS